MVIHPTFADFILFLYVHMSQADKMYDPAEMEVIKSKMANLFPAGTDFEQKLYTTIRQYNSFDKTKLKSLFEDTIRHFNKKDALKNVYADVQDIFNADGKVDHSETKALETLKQIIEMDSGK